MRYKGGKASIAHKLAPFINDFIHSGSQYVEPFCGSLGMTRKINPTNKPFILNDVDPYLITMWKAMQNGWIPPESISNSDYDNLKLNKDSDNPLTGYAGYFLSFSGMFFSKQLEPRTRLHSVTKQMCHDDPEKHAFEDFIKIKKAFPRERASFHNRSYEDLFIPEKSIVYCDPPYAGTAIPGSSKVGFDSAAFWEWAKDLHTEKGCIVIVSEFNCPDPDFGIIANIERPCNLKNGKHRFTEKLFLYGW